MNSTQPPNDRPRIGLITNPHSRRNRAALADVEAMLKAHNNIRHYITRSEDEISLALQTFSEQDVQIVAINGGDGTTTQIFAALLNASPFDVPPTVVLLPGGTTNMNAADTGMRGKLKASIRLLCRWSDGETIRTQELYRPILRVDGAIGHDALYGMFFGAGTIIRGIEYCKTRVHRVGLINEIGPGVALLRALWGILCGDPKFAAPVDAYIRLAERGDAPERQLVILLVSSLERLFLGMRPWWGSEQQPLHCTWVQKPTYKLLRKLPGLLRGKPPASATPENGYFSHNTLQIELDMDATFTIDGELFQASREHGPIRVSHGGAIKFLKIGP
ncbi:FIG00480695: hypothetical protein [hydrothermal vent metagenome]|uniref:DAGKc domain-containing protein n=1 Tax=hydrothermal vent metagenome TaxID=652676 RepID=A0A3B0YX94_9ZZZZ